MTPRREDLEETRSADALRLARRIAELYAAPPPTESARRRFDARLEARLHARPRPWGFALAAAAVALALAVLGERAARTPAPVAPAAPALAAVAEAESAEAVLELATGPVADPEDALPDDYLAIAFLILDAEGATTR